MSDSDMVLYGDAADFYTAVMSRDGTRDELGITALTTNAEIAALAEIEERLAREQGQIVRGIYGYLVGLRDELREESPMP